MTANPTNQNFENGKAAGEREDYAQAKEFFETAIEEGCTPAMTYLASMFEQGLGVEVDPQKTLELLYKAADLNDGEACNRLAYLHAVGKFVGQNFGIAVEFHKKAANLGVVKSQCDLGRHYSEGLGVQQSFVDAKRWYELAARSGHNLAQHKLASFLLSKNNPLQDTTAGINWLEVAASGGNVQAQFEAGCFRLGITYPELKDHKKAADWLDTAANNGSVLAVYEIGHCFEYGIGVEQSYQAAGLNYFEAFKHGNVEAAFALGTFFENGLGFDRNYEKAISFYRQAAEKFHVSALYNLGRMYHFGMGVSADQAAAHRLFLLAAERGHVICQFIVGKAHLTGSGGVKVNLEEGVSWITRAARSGLAEAQAELGVLFLTGKGGELDYSAALNWSVAAAEQGDAWGQYYAAHILIRHGVRGEAEFVEAVKWLVKSYNQPQQDGDRRHDFIKDDFKFIQSSLPPEVFEAACRDAESGELQRSQSQLGGHA